MTSFAIDHKNEWCEEWNGAFAVMSSTGLKISLYHHDCCEVKPGEWLLRCEMLYIDHRRLGTGTLDFEEAKKLAVSFVQKRLREHLKSLKVFQDQRTTRKKK